MNTFVEEFAAQLDSSECETLADLREFVDWRTQAHGGVFAPDAVDDVAIRSYLLHLKLSRGSRSIVQRTIASLKRFYHWAQTNGLIAKSPFDSFDLTRPLLSREQIRRREEARFASPMDREIAHLRALNHLAEELNRSPDARTLLTTVVETLAQAMGLKTAWAFLWTQAGLHATTGAGDPPHDFALAACCGLPPGLEQDNRGCLCQPPDCHCQSLLRNGRLVRAVNIVEYTRLRYAASHAGDTRGLLFSRPSKAVIMSRCVSSRGLPARLVRSALLASLQFL
jgi:hypothetical protein